MKKAEGIEHTRLTLIPEKCFANCSFLNHLTLPSTVRVIEDHAFCGTKLNNLELPPSLESMHLSALTDGTSSLSIPDTPINFRGYHPYSLQEVGCTLQNLSDLFFRRQISEILITVTLPDGTRVKLYNNDLTSDMAKKLMKAARTGSEEDWSNAAREFTFFKNRSPRRIWLLHCLAGLFLKGYALDLAKWSIQENLGDAVKYLYQNGDRDPAITLLREYSHARLYPSLLDELLALANENKDTAFAAVVLQARNGPGSQASQNFRFAL